MEIRQLFVYVGDNRDTSINANMQLIRVKVALNFYSQDSPLLICNKQFSFASSGKCKDELKLLKIDNSSCLAYERSHVYGALWDEK